MRRYLLLAGCLLAFACAEEPPETGTVMAKPWRAEYQERVDGGSYCVSYDKSGFCTIRIDNPDRYETRCAGGCFYLTLEHCERSDDKGEKCRKGNRQVPESIWGEYEVGQHYPNPQ
jgi:hypothetical protein